MRFKKDAIGYRDAVVATDTTAAKMCWTPARVAAANARAVEVAQELSHKSVHRAAGRLMSGDPVGGPTNMEGLARYVPEGRYAPMIRVNKGPDSGDYPIDCLISTGFNGDEVYATILFTGYPVMAVSCQANGEHGEPTYVPYEHQLMWTMGMEPWQEEILAHFLLHIQAVNEEFIEEHQQIGLERAFEGENVDDWHAIVGFVGEVAEKMHERHPDLCPDPRRVGF